MKNKLSRRELVGLILTFLVFILFTTSFAEMVNYVYDDQNRLIRVEYDDQRLIQYSYDAVGNRIQKVVGVAISAQPTGLTATPVSSTQIDVSWTDNSNNENGFTIERKLGIDGTYEQIATVGANVTTYSDTGLTVTDDYYYRMVAYNASGSSVYTNEAVSNYPPVKLVGATVRYYDTFQAAYNAAADGDIIQSQAIDLVENVTMDRDIAVTLEGGYDDNYVSNSDSKTFITGMIAINAGIATIENIVLEK